MPRNPSNPLAPVTERAMPEPTLRVVFADYKRMRRIKQATLEQYENQIERCFPDWWDRDLNDIRKDEILDRHLELSNRNGPRGTGATEANRAFAVLRAVYRFAEGRYEDARLEPVIRRNPVAALTACKAWNKSKRRSSIIPRHQMKAWFQAVQQYRNDSVRDYLTFIYLTGCRRTEAVTLRWSWVDLEAGIIAFPAEAVKNATEFILPLSGYLWHMLKARQARADKDPIWVFPGGVKGQHLSNRLKITDKIYARTGISWTVHDLRRGFATVANSCIGSDLVLKRLLNHKTASQDVTAGYVITDPETLRPHVEKVAELILGYSGYKFVPHVGLVPIENAAQVESQIQEDALLAALRKLDKETLQAIAAGATATVKDNVVSFARRA